MNLIQIVKSGLIQNGFDGLVNPGLCGCLIDDLSPGNCICDGCEGGYKHTHSVTGEWIVSVKKDAYTDEAIQQIIDEC